MLHDIKNQNDGEDGEIIQKYFDSNELRKRLKLI